MQSLKKQEKFAVTMQDRASSSVNGTGTCGNIDTPVTQLRSLSDHRAALIAKRLKVGADTPAGRLISTAVRQLENLQTYERPSWANDPRQTLPYQLKQTLARLGG